MTNNYFKVGRGRFVFFDDCDAGSITRAYEAAEAMREVWTDSLGNERKSRLSMWRYPRVGGIWSRLDLISEAA